MKILVADDDPVVVALLNKGLRKRGFEVDVASDTMQVVMKAMRGEPDAIVMDINMPGGTGIAALRRLKMSVKTNLIPIIAMTGSATAEVQSEALSLGAIECLEKPIDIERLSERLTAVIEG